MGVVRRSVPQFGANSVRRRIGAPGSKIAIGLVAVLSLLATHLLVNRIGADLFVFALAGLLVAAIFAVISIRNWVVPFAIWILAVGGFRFLWTVEAGGLPDLYFDRVMLIWLGLVFLVKSVVEKRAPAGPYTLDVFILCHGLYILTRVYIQHMHFVQPWFMSIAIPYCGYFLGKNIIDTPGRIRALWWALIGLVVYYSFTSIVEKYRVDALIFPRNILEFKDLEFRGRSIGPFIQPGVFGTSFAMLLPIHLYFLATVRSAVGRLLVGVCFIAAAVGLMFTYTRGSWLAGAAGLGVAALLSRKRYLPLLAPAALIGCFVGLFVLGVGQDKFMKERFENEDTLGSRVGTAVTALRVWRDSPIFGVGFFQFGRVREDYIEPVNAPFLGTIRFVQFRDNPLHDIYLGPLAEDGLVGAVLQYGIYFLILRNILRKRRSMAGDRNFTELIMPVCIATFAAYFVGGLAFDYRFFSFMGTLFYMTAGILEGYRSPESANVS